MTPRKVTFPFQTPFLVDTHQTPHLSESPSKYRRFNQYSVKKSTSPSFDPNVLSLYATTKSPVICKSTSTINKCTNRLNFESSPNDLKQIVKIIPSDDGSLTVNPMSSHGSEINTISRLHSLQGYSYKSQMEHDVALKPSKITVNMDIDEEKSSLIESIVGGIKPVNNKLLPTFNLHDHSQSSDDNYSINEKIPFFLHKADISNAYIQPISDVESNNIIQLDNNENSMILSDDDSKSLHTKCNSEDIQTEMLSSKATHSPVFVSPDSIKQSQSSNYSNLSITSPLVLSPHRERLSPYSLNPSICQAENVASSRQPRVEYPPDVETNISYSSQSTCNTISADYAITSIAGDEGKLGGQRVVMPTSTLTQVPSAPTLGKSRGVAYLPSNRREQTSPDRTDTSPNPLEFHPSRPLQLQSQLCPQITPIREFDILRTADVVGSTLTKHHPQSLSNKECNALPDLNIPSEVLDTFDDLESLQDEFLDDKHDFRTPDNLVKRPTRIVNFTDSSPPQPLSENTSSKISADSISSLNYMNRY